MEEKLAAFVGFDAEQKGLAGCYVSIGQDGTPFVDKGLVKPEHRKQLASLLKDDGNDGEIGQRQAEEPLVGKPPPRPRRFAIAGGPGGDRTKSRDRLRPAGLPRGNRDAE